MARYLTDVLLISLILAAIFLVETEACGRGRSRRRSSRRSPVCGTYDPRVYTCCQGHRYLGGGQSCCGTKAYSIQYYTCCRSVLTHGKGLSCCGTAGYNLGYKRCCNGRVVSGLFCY